MSSSNDRASDVVRNHTGQDGIRLIHADDDIATAADSLKDMKPKLTPGFSQQLSECALSRVRDFGNALYLLSDYGARDESAMLEEVQFYDYLFGTKSHFLEKLDKVRTPAEYQSIWQTARQEWKPKISKPPTERWLKRAENLKSEGCELAAMKKFQSLLNEMDDLSRMVKEAAEQYDNQMQLQLDMLRGK